MHCQCTPDSSACRVLRSLQINAVWTEKMSGLSRYNLNSAFLLQHLILLFLNPRNLWSSARPVCLHGSEMFLLSFWEYCQYTSLPPSDATVLLRVYVLFHLDRRNVRPFLLYVYACRINRLHLLQKDVGRSFVGSRQSKHITPLVA